MGLFEKFKKKDEWFVILLGRTGGLERLFWIVERADKGDEKAKTEVSIWFRERIITSDEYNELRRRVYVNKASQGDANAQYWMGLLSEWGYGDRGSTFSWFNQAAENGNTEAMLALALRYGEFANNPDIYGDSRLVVFGYNEAKEWYWTERAARAGNKEAQYKLGDLCKWAGKIDDAIYWLTMASSGSECDIQIKTWRSLADIYADPRYPEYKDETKQEDVLIKILCCKQKNEEDVKAYDESAYESAAFALGLLYCRLFESTQNEKLAWVALYCLNLAMIRGNDMALDFVAKLPCKASKELWDEWCYDARNLLYNPRW